MATILPSTSSETTPLPDFVFPARPSPTSTSAPSSFSKATGRRPISSVDIAESLGKLDNSRLSTAAELPQFSFNPSAETENADSRIASPPLSPQHRSIPSRSGFHKRGTSEYIGGDGATGSGLGLMSTSPTKGDNVLPTPHTISSLGPQSNRRGHAHRRSAAISQHDLSFILKPTDANAVRMGGSAPCSPSVNETHQPFPGLRRSSNTDTDEINAAPKASRARVGFSDDVQFIPRPLSLVSSESSGTTIRPGGHSVSGSISSIISASSPSSKDKGHSPEIYDARPKTASARLDGNVAVLPTLDAPSPRRRRSNPLLPSIAAGIPETPPTPKSPNKIWSFFSGNDSPQSRPTSAASHKESQPQTQTPQSPVIQVTNVPVISIEPTVSRRSSIASRKKKQKKVKSWAGSILSRKARQRGQKQSRRSPTPPNRSYGSLDAPSKEFSPSETAIPESPLPQKNDLNTDFSSWVPRHVYTPEDDSNMSPIIDLDAALGPFNTPGRDPIWEAINGTGSRKGKRMHSAAGMGNFGGPGMHYHRRAASSPELENPRFGMRHLNSSSTMADVFEEEEEDAWEDSKSSVHGKTEDDEESAIDIKVVDTDTPNGEKIVDWTIDDEESAKRGIKRKGSGFSETERRHVSISMKSTASSMKDGTISEESASRVEIFDDSALSRPVSSAQSSESTATPPLRARAPKDLAPVDVQPFSLQPPYLTPTSPYSITQSSMPSPRSPFSYDTQRISTAPSSLKDEGGLESLLLGEPGPEFRMSTDIHDVPSLTSSNSTMTRETNWIPHANNGPQFREGQRSASFSAAATRKRSSMASLSRLISSSHGEKSKLSMEIRAPSLDTERKEKNSKTKRISRMMQFWKPKEST